MESLKKSLQSHGSYKHTRRASSSRVTSKSHEELPILHNLLLDDDDTDPHQRSDDSEVVVKIDGYDHPPCIHRSGQNTNNSIRNTSNFDIPTLRRQASTDFTRDSDAIIARSGGGASTEDPPSKLIGQFLTKQSTYGGEVFLDMDLEMEELRQDARSHDHKAYSPAIPNSPANRPRSRDLRVSFDQKIPSRVDPEPETPKMGNHRSTTSSDDDKDNDAPAEVLKCSSNVAFRRRPSMLRAKTRSRLMDPPDDTEERSCRIPRSGQLRSGLLSSRAGDEEDDELFLEEDLPDEFKNANFSTLTLLQWLSLILIAAVLIGTLSISVLKKKSMWKLKLWKWEVMVLVLICGRLVSGWGIKLIVFFVESNFLLKKRVLYFVYGVRKPVQNSLWLGLVLIAWNALFDGKIVEEESARGLGHVTKVLVCLLVGTLVWLVKTLIIKVLASSFHVSTYFDRIRDSVFNQHVIETLSGPPLIEMQGIEEEEENIAAELQTLQNAGANVPSELEAAAFSKLKSGRVIGATKLKRGPEAKSMKFSRVMTKKVDEEISINHLHKLNPRNVSAWKMKRLMKIVRHGSLYTLDERVVNSSHEDESTNLIRSENEAKAAARKIFLNVAKQEAKYIYLEDLMRFIGEDEAWKLLLQIEGAAERKKIGKKGLKNWLVNVFRERKALALTLNDTKTAVNKLHHVVNAIVAILLVVIWLLILGIATSRFLLFLSSQLLLVAFIFGNTCKTIFEAIIFVFVMHPFDVGDRCEVDGVQMIVEEMNILTTIFLRYDNQKITYPNSTLSTKCIGNYYRSPEMGDAVEFCVHISTPAEKIALLKQRIASYIDNKKEIWCPSPMIIMKDVEELNRVRLAVWLSHQMNHQDMGERWARRALLVEEMVKIFRELDLQYRLLPLDINVCSMPSPVTSNRFPPAWNGS